MTGFGKQTDIFYICVYLKPSRLCDRFMIVYINQRQLQLLFKPAKYLEMHVFVKFLMFEHSSSIYFTRKILICFPNPVRFIALSLALRFLCSSNSVVPTAVAKETKSTRAGNANGGIVYSVRQSSYISSPGRLFTNISSFA